MPDAGSDAAAVAAAIDIERAARLLAGGGLVAFATETVYGLGADAAQRDAVAAIYATKGRPAGHPLIVHVVDLDAARWWADLPPRAEALARRFWPGPLTMIVPRREQAPAWACGGQPTIGLRCPSHPLARALLAAFARLGGHGVAAPSANRFGRISPTSARHVRDDLADAIAAGRVLVLDGGEAEVGLESTIVDLSRARPVLLRPGAIGARALADALDEPVEVSANVVDPAKVDAAAPRASGTLAAHYAPRTPLSLAGRDELPAVVADARAVGRRLALLLTDDASAAGIEPRSAGGPVVGVEIAPADADAYGRRLYAALRRLDAVGADRIVVQAPARTPAWQAVWDRLLRAARGSGHQ
ncbi:MAG: L-threonylcarbamoyladenylate synthase [Burkholderiaceae bacterium]